MFRTSNASTTKFGAFSSEEGAGAEAEDPDEEDEMVAHIMRLYGNGNTQPDA